MLEGFADNFTPLEKLQMAALVGKAYKGRFKTRMIDDTNRTVTLYGKELKIKSSPGYHKHEHYTFNYKVLFNGKVSPGGVTIPDVYIDKKGNPQPTDRFEETEALDVQPWDPMEEI